MPKIIVRDRGVTFEAHDPDRVQVSINAATRREALDARFETQGDTCWTSLFDGKVTLYLNAGKFTEFEKEMREALDAAAAHFRPIDTEAPELAGYNCGRRGLPPPAASNPLYSISLRRSRQSHFHMRIWAKVDMVAIRVHSRPQVNRRVGGRNCVSGGVAAQ